MGSTNRIWVIAGSLIIVAVLALAGLLGVKPQLDAAQASEDSRASVDALNGQHRTTLASLKEEFTRLPEITADVAELRKSVSGDIDLDPVIAELAALQASNGVTIIRYESANPIPFVPTDAVIADVPASVNSSNFLITEIKVSVQAPIAPFMNFVRGLQSSSRLYFVSDIAAGPLEVNSVTFLVYTFLDEPLVDPAAAVPAPAPEAAAAE